MLLLLLSGSDIHFSYSVWKPFPISLPVLLIKMQFTFLGKIWYSKMSFCCESECTFPWNKNSGKNKKNAIGNVEQIILSFQPGYIRKKEITSKSKWTALVFFSYFEKMSTFFSSCSILSVQNFPYETLRMFCTGLNSKFLFNSAGCFRLHIKNELWSFFLLSFQPLMFLLETNKTISIFV